MPEMTYPTSPAEICFFGLFFEFESAYLVGKVGLAGGHEFDLFPLVDGAVDHFVVSLHAAERIEHRVEYQGLKRCVRIAFRSGDAFHDGAQNVLNPLSGLARGVDDVLRTAVDQGDDVVRYFFRFGRGKVDLVEHRDDGQPVFQGQV